MESVSAAEHERGGGRPRPAETEERAGAAGSVGRRPAHYTGSDGWASRVAHRTLWGAAFGTGTGLLVGMAKGSHLPKWAGIVGTNCALVTLCFCGSQEFVRELRAADPDDVENCVLGGLLSGGFLGRIQGGRSRALPCALLFAGLGTALQLGANQWKKYRLQEFLDENRSETSPRPDIEIASSNPEGEAWKFPEWFPIQVLDEKAAEKRKLEQDIEFRARVDRVHKG